MDRADKVAFIVLLIVLGSVSLGLMLGVKYIGTTLFSWFSTSDNGLGYKEALAYSTGLSALLIVLFALVAGDGIIGELPSMLVGFALFTLFFTMSLAWIF